MKYEEISRLVDFNEEFQSSNFMVNEVFDDLKANIKNAPHIAFAYSHLYLSTWLYRYSKHFNVGVFDNAKIKEILGYDPNNRTMNYLIKKGGLLDKMGYTTSTKDFPVDSKLNDDKDLEFTMSSEFKDMGVFVADVPKMFFLKRPTKGFDRILVDEKGEEYDAVGTFREIGNTHNIPFEVFLYCMDNEEVGCTGFYLYSYLSHKNDIHEGKYDVSLENLAKETGISGRALDKYLGALKSFKLVDFILNQEFFAIGMRDFERKSNTYIVNEHYGFSNIPIPFATIEIMKKQDYFEMIALENPPMELIEFNLGELPF